MCSRHSLTSKRRICNVDVAKSTSRSVNCPDTIVNPHCPRLYAVGVTDTNVSVSYLLGPALHRLQCPRPPTFWVAFYLSFLPSRATPHHQSILHLIYWRNIWRPHVHASEGELDQGRTRHSGIQRGVDTCRRYPSHGVCSACRCGWYFVGCKGGYVITIIKAFPTLTTVFSMPIENRSKMSSDRNHQKSIHISKVQTVSQHIGQR